MKRDIYAYLSVLAMVAVPIAPAFYFGFDVAQDVYNLVFGWVGLSSVSGVFAVLIGLGAVIGLELVGILSGHNIVKYVTLGMYKVSVICGLILVAYVVLGIIGLEGFLTKGVVMFLTAPLVYVLATMQQTAAGIHTKQDENDRVLLEFDLAEKAKNNELERELKRQKQADSTALKLVRAKAKVVSNGQVKSAESSGKMPTDYRKLSDAQKLYLSELTREERQKELSHLSGRTFRNWNEKLDELTAHKNGKVVEMS